MFPWKPSVSNSISPYFTCFSSICCFWTQRICCSLSGEALLSLRRPGTPTLLEEVSVRPSRCLCCFFSSIFAFAEAIGGVSGLPSCNDCLLLLKDSPWPDCAPLLRRLQLLSSAPQHFEALELYCPSLLYLGHGAGLKRKVEIKCSVFQPLPEGQCEENVL